MKWLYLLFFVFAVLVLGGSAYIRFLIPTSQNENLPIVYPSTQDVDLMKLHWAKERDYLRSYSNFILSSSVKLVFMGKLKAIKPGEITLEKDGKTLTITDETDITSTSYLDTTEVNNKQLTPIKISDFRVSDPVRIEAEIQPDGKLHIGLVFREANENNNTFTR